MPKATPPLFARSVTVERTLSGGAHVRLEVERTTDGRAHIAKAMRKRPGEERYTRAPHLEYTDTLEHLGLPTDTLDTLA